MGSQIYSYLDGHGGFQPYPAENKINPETLSNIAMDVEVYIAGIASCLPGLRLFVRGQTGQSDKERALEQAITMNTGDSWGSWSNTKFSDAAE